MVGREVVGGRVGIRGTYAWVGEYRSRAVRKRAEKRIKPEMKRQREIGDDDVGFGARSNRQSRKAKKDCG